MMPRPLPKAIWRLSQELSGHTFDIISLAVDVSGKHIVSTSRDKSAILWKLHGGRYVEAARMRGHEKTITSVCFIKPSVQHPKGLVITASHDGHICIYTTGASQPSRKLNAHGDASVTCVRSSVFDDNSFLTSSWDCTAKLWNVFNLHWPFYTYRGHTRGLYCVSDLPNSNVVTGSNDKLVIIHRRDGEIIHKLLKHEGPVRDICVMSRNRFLTCGNDRQILEWDSRDGTCLRSFVGHENHVYNVSLIPVLGEMVVSSSEDNSVRVWDEGKLYQTILPPSQSVWCARALPNGDFACACSDYVIRIFTRDPGRYADRRTTLIFETSPKKLRGIDILRHVYDASALRVPGWRDEDNVLVKEAGDTVKVYKWSDAQAKWSYEMDALL